jgi:hypothetical protein
VNSQDAPRCHRSHQQFLLHDYDQDEESDQKGQFMLPGRQPNSLARYLFFAQKDPFYDALRFRFSPWRALIVIVPAATNCHIRGEVVRAS